MSKRKNRATAVEDTEEILIPSASRGAQRAHLSDDDQVAGNYRTLKRRYNPYFPPAPSLRNPVDSPDIDTPGFTEGHDFNAVPSQEDIERYLNTQNVDAERMVEPEYEGQRTFATLVR